MSPVSPTHRCRPQSVRASPPGSCAGVSLPHGACWVSQPVLPAAGVPTSVCVWLPMQAAGVVPSVVCRTVVKLASPEDLQLVLTVRPEHKTPVALSAVFDRVTQQAGEKDVALEVNSLAQQYSGAAQPPAPPHNASWLLCASNSTGAASARAPCISQSCIVASPAHALHIHSTPLAATFPPSLPCLVLQGNDLVAEVFYNAATNPMVDAINFNSYRVRSAAQTLGLHMGPARSHASIVALSNRAGPEAMLGARHQHHHQQQPWSALRQQVGGFAHMHACRQAVQRARGLVHAMLLPLCAEGAAPRHPSQHRRHTRSRSLPITPQLHV